jgi:PhoH-like ATPase
VGDNTKIILTGDPYQIDNPYLDASSNGLTYATERLKGLKLHGHMTLKTSERSALAAAAAQYL